MHSYSVNVGGGYIYQGCWECEDDGSNKKIEHEIQLPSGEIIYPNFSPYTFPSESDIKEYLYNILHKDGAFNVEVYIQEP